MLESRSVHRSVLTVLSVPEIKYDLHRRRYADNADGRAAGTADELDR